MNNHASASTASNEPPLFILCLGELESELLRAVPVHGSPTFPFSPVRSPAASPAGASAIMYGCGLRPGVPAVPIYVATCWTAAWIGLT